MKHTVWGTSTFANALRAKSAGEGHTDRPTRSPTKNEEGAGPGRGVKNNHHCKQNFGELSVVNNILEHAHSILQFYTYMKNIPRDMCQYIEIKRFHTSNGTSAMPIRHMQPRTRIIALFSCPCYKKHENEKLPLKTCTSIFT